MFACHYFYVYVLHVCRGMEEFLKYSPRLINTKKDDGFTALHVAVINGHADIVSLLASHVRPYLRYNLE